jgi:AcrR family transcriptional regulator
MFDKVTTENQLVSPNQNLLATTTPTLARKRPLRERQFQEREDAILVATISLLRQHGYELMTLDEVAGEVGIAKGSIYKHFASKEKLAAAVMTRLFQKTLDALNAMPEDLTARARLEALLRWTLLERANGSVPHLPSTSPTLSIALMSDTAYVQALMALNVEMLALIRIAQDTGDIDPSLPDEFVMYTLYSRTCDPTLDMLTDNRKYSAQSVVDWLVSTCFSGLRGAT